MEIMIFLYFIFLEIIRYYCFMNTNHHHHYVVPPARITLTLSRHFSLSFIASGSSSGLQPVSSQSSCMYVQIGRPAFVHLLKFHLRPHQEWPQVAYKGGNSGVYNLDYITAV